MTAPPSRTRPPLALDDPVGDVPGVGPARAAQLERIGVTTVGGLLRLLPRRYEDRSALAPIAACPDGAPVTFAARVLSAGTAVTARRRRRIFRAVLGDDTGRVEALWFRFRLAHVQPLLRPGTSVIVHGTIVNGAGRRQVLHPEIETLGEDGDRRGPAVRPVYPATEGLGQATLRALVRRALALALPGIKDPVPPAVRERLGLPGLAEALLAMHAPETLDTDAAPVSHGSPWRRRLVFDELFGLQLGLVAGRRRGEAAAARRVPVDAQPVLARLRAALPFRLTAAQERVCGEILGDLSGPRPMQRLLQGDVGSGKTVVAALAALAAVSAGGQAALMAPTELLAEQHYLSLGRLAGALGIPIALLVGGQPAASRTRALAGIASGRVGLAIGTHALLEPRVAFARLTLAIVDEQHRFGVRQRLRLREKGEGADLLVMTATPIPRSLALALYGDLDLSTIDELPPGRRQVRTRVVGEPQRREAWDLVRAELALGRRAYVVCPLIEEQGEEDPAAAVRTAERLRAHFPGVAVGLVHGGLPLAERARAMERFRSGETPLLVATTLVEVGLDVPEATAILVERAERFGLSQLHQLRGRVGRGPDPGHCLLATGPRPSPEALARLAVLTRTADGFAIAEADLGLRGPGQLAGARQAGLAGLRLADLVRDRGLLAAAREEALRIGAADPLLESPAHRPLRSLLIGAGGVGGVGGTLAGGG